MDISNRSMLCDDMFDHIEFADMVLYVLIPMKINMCHWQYVIKMILCWVCLR